MPFPFRYPAILQTRAGRPHAVSGRPILIHTYHAVPMPRCAVTFRGCFQNGIFVAWQGNGMACVNQTRPHCVIQMGQTQSKPLAERHGMCELALILSLSRPRVSIVTWTCRQLAFSRTRLWLNSQNNPLLGILCWSPWLTVTSCSYECHDKSARLTNTQRMSN
jgi:hypothetical protein